MALQLALVGVSAALGTVNAILATLAVAAVVPAPAVFLSAGLIAATITTYGLLRAVLRRSLGGRRARRYAGAAVVVLVAAISTVAATTVLRPFPAQLAGITPPDVRFWELPTGSRIAYVQALARGRSGPTPVIFLHGGPGTPGEGIPAGGPELAAAGFDVYAYDQLGAGRSTRLGDVTGYTVQRQVRDLEAIRHVLGAEKLILVGRSWGGSLAAQYLAAHSDHVAAVVFVAPGPIWGGLYKDRASVGEPWHQLDATDRRRHDQLVRSPRMAALALLMEVSPEAAHALVPDSEADSWMHQMALTGRDTTTCDRTAAPAAHDNRQGFYVNQLTTADFARIPDPRPALAMVHVPALILAPQCDYIRWPITREYRDILPNATLVDVRGAGHAVSAEQPHLYTQLLLTFLLGDPLPLPAYTAGTSPPGRRAAS